jgi:putative ABC transport system permease protein
MRFLLTTLSFSYARSHLAKTLLTLLAVAVGVATFSAIRTAHQTLTDGIRATVDRMAGKAHLQITMEGGVPEEIQEAIRDLPGIRATAPVIEQIVTPVKAELGSVLVLGVDLLGDREMREYGFEGDDADIDDPLLFLAQPDSIVIARPLAEKAGVKLGDTFSFNTPLGPRNAVIRGLLTPKGFAEAFGGNLIVTDVYSAQTLFGRGRNFDRLEVRLLTGVSIAEGTATLSGVLGPAYRVETPDRRSENLERIISNFIAGFNISSIIALGIGTFLIFNAFHVAVNRRRRDIGTLRSLGATPRQVLALFLLEAAVIGALGGALGLFLGSFASQSFLEMMGKTTEQIFGVTGSGRATLTPLIAVQALVMGVSASLIGAFLPAREGSRIAAVEAFAKGASEARELSRPLLRIALGFGLLAFSMYVGILAPFSADGTTITSLVFGAMGVVFLVGPFSRYLLRAVAPLYARFIPVAGQLSADALRQNPLRTGGTVMATTISLAFVLGLGGHMGATKASTIRWMDDMLTSDLYVRGSVNWARPDYRYPASLKEELLRVEGVRAVESFRNSRAEFRGDTISLASIEMGAMMNRTRREFVEGDETSMRRGLIEEGKCSVSDNFSRRFGLHAGDTFELPAPGGMVPLTISAVTRDLSNDRGVVYVDRETFLKHWKDDRVDVYDISVVPGADPHVVRDSIHKLLGGRHPSLISTRQEFVREITQAVDAFFALIRVTLFLALLIASLGIASSLLISVAERSREIGVLKALGAVSGQITASIVLEGLTLAFTGLLFAIPIGNLMALFMEKVVADLYTGWTMPHLYPWALLGFTFLALPVVAVAAAFVPARQAVSLDVTEALTYE